MSRGGAGSTSRDRQAGLTLIEVLVVLAIIGIMTGVTVLGGGLLDRGGRAEAEAMRLAERLQLAADTAMVTSTPLALVWDAEGYRFLGWDAAAGHWSGSGEPSLDPRHVLPGALRLEAAAEGEPAPILIAPDLPNPPVALRLVGGGTAWNVGFDGFAAEAEPARTP